MKRSPHIIKILVFALLFIPLTMFAKKPAMPSSATQIVSGNILDKETKEDLGGAYLYFEDIQKGVFSGPDGKFELDGIIPGKYKVTVKFISYHEKQVTLQVGKSKKNYTEILLEPIQP
jgi:hypothetical protein